MSMNQRTTGPHRGGLNGGLAITTEIATPRGWSAMGALRTGDEVFDENGCRTKVLSVR